jgi:hypothetical protein
MTDPWDDDKSDDSTRVSIQESLKKALSSVVQQTERSKKDLLRVLADEVKTVVRTLDVAGELRKALTGLKIQVKADITFTDTGAPHTEVRTQVVADKDTKDKEHADK